MKFLTDFRNLVVVSLFLLAFFCATVFADTIDGSESNGDINLSDNAEDSLFWISISSDTDLLRLKTDIESAGGEIISLAPEGKLLVQGPSVGLSQIYDSVAVKKAGSLTMLQSQAVDTVEPAIYGALPATPEEQEYIDRVYTIVKHVQPEALAEQRALLYSKRSTAVNLSRPDMVDNSVSMYFPPIGNQGSQGSCTAWATGYYFNTYTQARDENLDAASGNPDVICSPAFLYPLANSGFNTGASTHIVLDLLNKVGCSSLALMPYSVSDYWTWPTEQAWIDALKRRTGRSYSIGDRGLTDEDMEALKQHLANGHIAVTVGQIFSNWLPVFREGVGISNGVLYQQSGSPLSMHAMTVVGYDDNRGYVDNEGLTRYGAVLVANSFGDNWGTYNTAPAGSRFLSKGFMWISYDLFKSYGWAFGIVIYNDDRVSYRPKVYAVSGLNHSGRWYVGYSGGVGDTSEPDWSSYQPIYRSGGGYFPIDDTKRVAVDLTDGIPDIRVHREFDLFVKLSIEAISSSNGTITSAEFFHDLDGDDIYNSGVSPDPPIIVSPGESVYVTYNIPQDQVPVYFPDASLKQAVEEELGLSHPTPSDLLVLTQLNVSGKDVVDLSGLEYAVNLTELHLQNNLVGDILPLLELTNLTMLDLSGNDLHRMAYCIYLPLIQTNNPGIDLRYDSNPHPFDCSSSTVFVDIDAVAGDNNGTSWADAFTDLQDALEMTIPGDEIRVAQGIYYPTRRTDPLDSRTATFCLLNGVTINGGYAGCSQPEPDEQNVKFYETVLSGDLNRDDGSGFANNGDNSYHVITGSGTNETAVLDGFSITSGNAYFPSYSRTSLNRGGGVYNFAGSPTLNNCTLRGNSADFGGGMHNEDCSNAVLTNCEFFGNSAISGAAISSNNTNSGEASILTLTNSTFTGNSADSGGGIYVTGNYAEVIVTNCILWGNSGGEIDGGANVTVTYSNVMGGYIGDGNIDVDPLFIDRNGADNILNSADDNLRLLPGSLCINAGTNSTPFPLPSADLAGDSRIMDGIVDMGAYEGPKRGFLLSTESLVIHEGQTEMFTVSLTVDPMETVEVTVVTHSGDPDITVASGERLIFDSTNYSVPQTVTLAAALDTDKVAANAQILISSPGFISAGVTAYEVEYLYVDIEAGGNNDGSSWIDAYVHIQDALTAVTAADLGYYDILVAQGTYKPDQGGSQTLGDRKATFLLVNGVSVYGGFPAGGGEFEDRDPNAHETILSGDLNSDDSDWHDNSYHVVSCGGETNALIDGFTITAGFTYSGPISFGGGLYNQNGNLTVNDCIFRGNSRNGMYNQQGNATVTNCTFINNSYGGMYNSGTAMLTNCLFSQNDGSLGGGLLSSGDVTLKDCDFIENTVFSGEGGGIYNSGDMTVTDCSFIGNEARASYYSPSNLAYTDGGGIYNYNTSGDSITLSNCVFTGNKGKSGGGLYSEGSGVTLTDCTFTDNSAIRSSFQGGDGGGMYGVGTLTNCTFSGNSADQGGGLYGGGILSNCIFSGNEANSGGGMYTYYRAGFFYLLTTLNGCTFSGNSANYGGGILSGTDVEATNCIMWGNSAWYGDEILIEGYAGWGWFPSIITVNYSDVQGGSAAVYIGEDECTLNWGDGNIDMDPLFADADNGDCHLVEGSPCIDAGDPNRQIIVSNEYHVSSVEPVELNHLNIDISTIVATKIFGEIFTEGEDYTITEVNGKVMLNMASYHGLSFYVDYKYLLESDLKDFDGNPRFIDGDGDGNAVVDMGAYEFVPLVECSMKFTPQAVNLFAKGKWVKGHIVLPEGYSVADVDAGAGARLEPFGVDSHHVDVFVNDDGLVEIETVFERSQLRVFYAAGSEMLEVTVSGKFVSRQCFYGVDTIKTMRMVEYIAVLSLHWLETDCMEPDWCGGADVDHSSVVDMGDLIFSK